MKKILKTSYHTAVIILFLALAAAGFTQTKTFRTYIRSLALTETRKAVNGTLEFGSLEGNLLTGLSIRDVRLRRGENEVLTAERLEARYDLWGFLRNRVSLRRITLVRPRISLWRSESGQWNIEGLFRSGEPDTSSTPLIVDIRNAELLDATVSVVDSLSLKQRAQGLAEPPATNAVDFSNIQLRSFTLRAATRIENGISTVSIKYLGFHSRLPELTLENLSGDFVLGPRETSVKNLVLKTKGSQIRLSTSLRNLDITAIPNLRQFEKAPVELSLNVDRLDFNELKMFLPEPLAFLDKSAAFDLQAKGTFGRLHVDHVTVRSPRTFVKIRGWITNLHQPEFLELDVAGSDNILHPEEALELLPGLHLPDLRPLGVVNCQLAFTGRTNNFKALVDANLSSGRIKAEASLDLRREPMIYNAAITTEGIDLAQILEERTLASSLNIAMTIKGSGTSLQSMRTVARAEIDSSLFLGLPLRHSVVVLDLADRILRSRLSLAAGHTAIDLTGRTTFGSNDSLSYLIGGTINSLNLAEVLRNQNFDSDLSFALSLEGSGIRFADMHAKLAADFSRSTFRNESFERRSFTLEFDASDSAARTLTLQSDAADVAVVGSFTPPDVLSTVEQTGALLASALSHRFEHLDSLKAGSVRTRGPQVFRHSFRTLPAPVNAKVNIHVKDFYPLGVVLGSPMDGSAALEASVQGSLNDLELSGKVNVDHFSLGTKVIDLELARSSMTFDLSNLRRVQTLESLHSFLSLSAEQVSVDSLSLAGVQFTHRLIEDSSNFSVTALVDSLFSVDLEGSSQFKPNKIEVFIPHLTIRTADQPFENENPLRIVYGQDGFILEDFSIRHETEAVTLAGHFDPSGVSNVRFSLENFLLTNLKFFSRDPGFIERVKDFGGLVTVNGSFAGTTRNPKFAFDLFAEGTRIAQGTGKADVVFGQITARGSYLEGLSSVFVEFRNRPAETGAPPDLRVSGTMPLKIGSSTIPPSQGMDLSIVSRGFRLEFLDPFIPIMSNLTGMLICDMNLRGTLASPSYDGSLALQNARFYFSPLGIDYMLNGRLVPQGHKIALQDFSIRNTPEDLRDGVMNIGGTFTLEGIEIKDFTIQASGTLKVMKEETSRRTAESMYGEIIASSGSAGLQWYGSPDRSFVNGNVFIKNANLTFPPSRASILERSRTVTVSFVNDTSRSVGEDVRPPLGKSLATTAAGRVDSPPLNRAPDQNGFDSPSSNEERSFLDNIEYNLSLQTQGLTQIRFVFNPLTNEELFADLQGRLVFTKDRAETRLTGELEVGSRSYYKYFKSLNATGKLLFTGNPSNPELEILAKYEGTYRPNPDTTVATSVPESDRGEQKVTVTLEITGTRDEPKVKMGLERRKRNGEVIEVKDAQSDAITYLISGTFREDMTQAERASLLTTSLAGSIGSSLLSGPLTELVRKEVGFVSSIDVLYYGGKRSFEEGTDIRVTGEVGDAVIRFGGRVFNRIDNANVSIQLPMSSILGSEAFRNLIFELERRVEGVEDFDRRESNGIRLLYRITF